MAINLDAIPGYTELNNQLDALLAKEALLKEQQLAARENGDITAARQYGEQQAGLKDQQDQLATQIDRLVSGAPSPGPNPVTTTQQSQSTPAPNARDDGPTQAPTSSGVGAGTTGSSATSVNADDNPTPTSASRQTTISASTATLNQLIPTQPNQLDQYASYTYALSWYLLSTDQFNDMVASQKPNVAGWQLLMQSGGAPIKGRSPAFPLDYYMDDLEITTLIPNGGVRFAHSATDLKFKVTEPNGITLIQNLFNAVQRVYKNSQQSQTNTSNNGAPVAKSATANLTFNYLQAHYCMFIEFYGYDKDGNLVAPAKGAFNTSANSGGYGQTAVIKKYYPFRIVDIKFQIASRAIEYIITAKPPAQSYGFTTDRGTVPYAFTMAGATVQQLLNGDKVTEGGASTGTSDPGARKDTPTPAIPATLPSIVTGQDNPLATADGMDFTAGNF